MSYRCLCCHYKCNEPHFEFVSVSETLDWERVGVAVPVTHHSRHMGKSVFYWKHRTWRPHLYNSKEKVLNLKTDEKVLHLNADYSIDQKSQ